MGNTFTNFYYVDKKRNPDDQTQNKSIIRRQTIQSLFNHFADQIKDNGKDKKDGDIRLVHVINYFTHQVQDIEITFILKHYYEPTSLFHYESNYHVDMLREILENSWLELCSLGINDKLIRQELYQYLVIKYQFNQKGQQLFDQLWRDVWSLINKIETTAEIKPCQFIPINLSFDFDRIKDAHHPCNSSEV